MEVHPLDRHLVNLGLHAAEALEQEGGAACHALGQAGPGDHLQDLVEAAVPGMLPAAVPPVPDIELDGSDTGTGHPGGRQFAVRRQQRRQRSPDSVDRHAEIDQRAQHHVAGCARETVEIEDLVH